MKKFLILVLAMVLAVAPVMGVSAQEITPLTPTALTVELGEKTEEFTVAYARTPQVIQPNQVFWNEEKGMEVPGVFYPDAGQEGRTLKTGKFLAIADITAELENGVVFYNYTFHVMDIIVIKN